MPKFFKAHKVKNYSKICINHNINQCVQHIIEMSQMVFHDKGLLWVIFQIKISDLVHCGLSVLLAELYVPITTNILRFNNPSKKGRVGKKRG